MEKTLGGDRLGSGKKMKVHLHGYERSTHDKGYLWRSTMSSGTLVPFLVEVALPGDTFDINLQCEMMTHPTTGPLFGSYKVQLDTFVAPIRLYQAMLHNNTLGIGMNMAQVKLPQMELIAKAVPSTVSNVNIAQINPSCILAYLGTRGVGIPTDGVDTIRLFNAIPLLAYWEIYKNYYANKQEEIGAVIHNVIAALNTTLTTTVIDGVTITNPDSTALNAGTEMVFNYTGTPPLLTDVYLEMQSGLVLDLQQAQNGYTDTGTSYVINWNWQDYGNQTLIYYRYRTATDVGQLAPRVETFPLNDIDEMRKYLLQSNWATAVHINSAGIGLYNRVLDANGAYPNMLNTQEGLGVKTYQSDLFNNWLNTEWIDGAGGITELTSIDTSSGEFTLDTLNLAKKVYDMLNRIAVSGGSYDDWIDAVYTHDRYVRAESPMYMGGLIKELIFQEVVSNSASAEGDQPLGTLAGKGRLSGKHKGGYVHISVDEPSYVIGLVSLTPRIDYSQGNNWDTHLQTMDDLHKPALDEIGFQELITEQMAWWDTRKVGTDWIQQSAGKQPAWLNYMTNVNRTYGNFAIEDNEMFMTLNRRYEPEYVTDHFEIGDLTTYIDPVKFNNIFADTALDAQNFWAQIAVDMTVRRKMSAKIMPNL